MDNERKYFININGNNVGPLKMDEISERLANNLLTPDDYIFIIGDSDWKFIRDLNEFKNFVKPIEEKGSDKIWFVRKEKNNLGPFSILEITKMLESGQIDINDYAWKKGTKNWVTLKESGEFQLGMDAELRKEEMEPEKELPVKPRSTPSLEMIKPPDAESYIKPMRKRLLPELILGLIMFCVGVIVFGTNEFVGGLIAIGGLAVIVIFLRIRKK
jgi:hypothetical protein